MECSFIDEKTLSISTSSYKKGDSIQIRQVSAKNSIELLSSEIYK